MCASTTGSPTSRRSNGASSSRSSDLLFNRLRSFVEPLVLSFMTTLAIYHIVFSPTTGETAPATSTGLQGVLDAPALAAIGVRPLVKRRFPDPPKYDFHSLLPPDSPMPPIFYHIYVPEWVKGQTNALRIVKEQLEAFKPDHKLASSLQKNQNITVFFQTIGSSKETVLQSILDACQERNVTCHHLGHESDGREELTLNRAFEFCRDDANNQDDRRVVYMHNKGSHHKSTLNERWRRAMMRAVAHEKCLKPPVETCNLCSLFVTAERGIFPAGNFFVAQCGYLRKLLPPLEFEGHMERVVKEALYGIMEGELAMNLHPQWPPSFGTGRYAAENWAGSHPDVVPCDFSQTFRPQPHTLDNTLDFLDWVNTTTAAVKPMQWTMAPRHPIKIAKEEVRIRPRWRLLEYSLLAGHILRWYEFYDQVPGEFSWVWSWYPDGQRWRTAIRKHGRNALKEVAEGFQAKEHE